MTSPKYGFCIQNEQAERNRQMREDLNQWKRDQNQIDPNQGIIDAIDRTKPFPFPQTKDHNTGNFFQFETE